MERKTPSKKRTTKNQAGRTAPKKLTPTPKKAVTKKAKAPATVRRVLNQAPAEKAFWVNYGPILSDLRQLRDALGSQINDEQFGYHVNENKNDFAQWVGEVLGDTECAQALRQASNRSEAVRVTENSLVPYE